VLQKIINKLGDNIINISSGASKYPLPNASLYSATKAALDAFTIALSKELGAKNVRINSILPGATETEGATSAGVTKGSDYEKCLLPILHLVVEVSQKILRKQPYFLLRMTHRGLLESKFLFRVGCMAFSKL
jgi:short-subunit dehydrogenase